MNWMATKLMSVGSRNRCLWYKTRFSTLKSGSKISATVEEKDNDCNAQFQWAFSIENEATMPQSHGERLPQMPDLNIIKTASSNYW